MLKRILGAGLVILLVSCVFFYRDLQPQANIGAGYLAHQICSCVFVAQRTYASCLPDLPAAMDRIRSEVVDVEGRQGVRAWIPLLADRRALHTLGFGCSLD